MEADLTRLGHRQTNVTPFITWEEFVLMLPSGCKVRGRPKSSELRCTSGSRGKQRMVEVVGCYTNAMELVADGSSLGNTNIRGELPWALLPLSDHIMHDEVAEGASH